VVLIINSEINIKHEDDGSFDCVTMSEFIDIMNGEGYDDCAFEIAISPDLCPEDGYLNGWRFSFYNPISRRAVVVCDIIKGDYFELDVRPIDELINIMAALKDENKTAKIFFNKVKVKQ